VDRASCQRQTAIYRAAPTPRFASIPTVANNCRLFLHYIRHSYQLKELLYVEFEEMFYVERMEAARIPKQLE
jgi:hypothetical protein